MTMNAATTHVPSAAAPGLCELPSCWQRTFVEMLPKIAEHARVVLRDLTGERRDEGVQEVVCNCCCAFARLAERGRAHAATWSSLAKFGIAQFRAGRRVGSSLNVCDVTSDHCRLRKGVSVRSLHQWDHQDEEWREMLVEDPTCSPADLAASRIDYPAFLATLSRRNRRIAETLATGESTSLVAKMFGMSPGRVSQLRKELKAAWELFHTGPAGELAAA